MIGYLSGTLLETEGTKAIVDINGVGYETFSTPEYLSRLKTGGKVSFWINTIVREQEISLYGFETKDESRVFSLLMTVSGIGPKSALAILSVAGIKAVEQAIDSSDSAPLTKIAGVGKKTADKIVFELSGKMPKKKDAHMSQEDKDIEDALKSLGYRDTDINKAMSEMPDELSGTNERIKWALRHLSK